MRPGLRQLGLAQTANTGCPYTHSPPCSFPGAACINIIAQTFPNNHTVIFICGGGESSIIGYTMRNQKKISRYVILLLIAISALFTLASSQAHSTASGKPTAAATGNSSQHNETIQQLMRENKAVTQDLASALKQKTRENQQVVADTVNTVQAKLEETVNALDSAFPQLEVRSNPLLQQVLGFIRDYKEVAILVGGGLVTFFQMVFGGGLSYLTSRMKNLSEHKIKIQRGFDLQFAIYQKQQLDTLRIVRVSPAFQGLFGFLSYQDNKEIKVILGNTGIGFSTNIKQWIRRQQEREPTAYLYYDMCEPIIRIDNNLQATHLDNLTNIVYSLLYRQDRNFVLSLFKGLTEKVFTLCLRVWRFAENNRYLAALFIAMYYFMPQVCYYILLYILVKDFIYPVLLLLVETLFRIATTAEKIMLKSQAKDQGESIKVIIDNFQMLKGQYEGQFNETALQHIDQQLRLIAQKLPPNTPVTQPASPPSLEDHQKFFMSKLTSLFNDISALQVRKEDRIEFIVIVRSTQFYKRYMERLKLNSANLFKLKRFPQLTSKDIDFVIKERSFKQMIVATNEGNAKIRGLLLTRCLSLFHNSSKEVMKIMREANLDGKYCKPDNQPLSVLDHMAIVLGRSMNQVLVNAQRLSELLAMKPAQGKEQEEQFLKHIGLFLGCLHKKLLFFANRKENIRKMSIPSKPQTGKIDKNKQDGTLDLDWEYREMIRLMNQDKDLIPTISSSNRHYLFQKKGGVFSFKNDVRLMLLKWDELITYIEGDNDWAQTLEIDFAYYFIQNQKSIQRNKKRSHKDYHKTFMEDPSNSMQEHNQDKQKSERQKQKEEKQKQKQDRKQREEAENDALNEALRQKAKKIFEKVASFLSEREIISDHIFYSRSVALANFYLQEKIKEKMLYDRFQVKKCKLGNAIRRMEKSISKINQQKKGPGSEQIGKIREKFFYFINNEAKPYEEGMNWLKRYYNEFPDCDIVNKLPQNASKYLIQRSNNSYALRPYINDVLLYWDSFCAQLPSQELQALLKPFSADEKDLKAKMKRVKSKTTMCAYLYYERMQEEHEITTKLLGFRFQELKESVRQLEEVEQTDTKERRIRGQKRQDFKLIIWNYYTSFISCFQAKAQPDNQLKRQLFDYEGLLKLYLPDGLFGEININYRPALYSFNGMKYSLSQDFTTLLTIYRYIKCLLSNGKHEGMNEEDSPVQILAQKLGQSADCGEACRLLEKQDWLLLLSKGVEVKKALEEHLQNKQEAQVRTIVLFSDLKQLISALCYSYEKKQNSQAIKRQQSMEEEFNYI